MIIKTETQTVVKPVEEKVVVVTFNQDELKELSQLILDHYPKNYEKGSPLSGNIFNGTTQELIEKLINQARDICRAGGTY